MRLIDADKILEDVYPVEIMIVDKIRNAPTVDFGVDLDRLKELTQADKEGRCLVLPCKVGDKYYDIQRTCSDGGYAKKGEYFPTGSDCEYCDIIDCDKEFIIREHKFNSLNFIVDCMEYIGKFLFLTKEEAEKELEGLE